MKPLIKLDELWEQPEESPAPGDKVKALTQKPESPRIDLFDDLYKRIIMEQSRHNTDTFNAQEWSEYQSGNFIYNHTRSKWYKWTGSHWQEDTTEAVKESVKSFAAWLWDQTLKRKPAPDSQELKCVQTKCKTLCEIKKIEYCLSAARSIPRLSYVEEQFDSNPDLLNFANGTYNLDSHEFYKHRKKDLITHILPCNFDPNMKDQPNFDRFMMQTFGQEPELIKFVYEYLAMSLSGRITEQVFQFWYGTGANGKSVLASTIMELLSCYSRKVEFTILQDSYSNADKVQQEKARLKGIRFVLASEVSENRYLNEQLIKDLTSNDTLTARELYCRTFEFKPSHHLVIIGNHKPRIRGTDDGIRRRVLLIPFLHTVRKQDQIPTDLLIQSFRPEFPAIMNSLIQNFKTIQENGGRFTQIPDIVSSHTKAYFLENDLMANWIQECCELNQLMDTGVKEAYISYESYMKENETRPLGKIKFLHKLQEHIVINSLAIEVYAGKYNMKRIKGLGIINANPESGGDV